MSDHDLAFIGLGLVGWGIAGALGAGIVVLVVLIAVLALEARST